VAVNLTLRTRAARASLRTFARRALSRQSFVVRFQLRGRGLAFVLVALAVLLTPALLFAHARLLRSSPAASSRLSASPAAISLWFSERPELRFTTITVTDSTGTVMALRPVAVSSEGAMGVTAQLARPLSAGTYTVAWRTAAADGHPTSGTFRFTVQAGPVVPPPVAAVQPGTSSVASVAQNRPAARIQSNAPITPVPNRGARNALRWVELVAVLTMIGAVVFRLFVLPEAQWTHAMRTDASDRARRLASAVFVLFVVATIARLMGQADLIADAQHDRWHAVLVVARETRWGHGWIVGAVGGLLTILGLLAARRLWWGWIIAGIGTVGIGFGEGLTGHAAAAHHTSVALAADLAHLLGAGGWLGGLATLMVCGLPALRGAVGTDQWTSGSRLLRAYHRAAIECVVLVVITAVVAAWLRLSQVSDLWTTDYGRLLMRKSVLVAFVLAIGAYHWRTVVRPTWTATTEARFWRTAAAEILLGAIIVAVTAMLISTPFPAQ
jgi:methionine-rich copper-binding protein CopC/putative copper export protein